MRPSVVKMASLIGAAILLALFACGCDKQGRGTAMEISSSSDKGVKTSNDSAVLTVTIVPESPTAAYDLVAVTGGCVQVFSFDWTVNGISLRGEDSKCLPSGFFAKGDTVSVLVTADSKKSSDSVVIGNSPPQVVSVSFDDPYIQRGKDILVTPEVLDLDGDSVGFSCAWYLNGEKLLFEDSPVLKGDLFKKGDRIFLEITPFDQLEDGPIFRGAEFVIPNSPPYILSSPQKKFEDNLYVYKVQAEDPDGDQLRYSLESAPQGMAIDSRTGEIQWPIGDEVPSECCVKIVVEDEEGLKACQEYTLALSVAR